MNSANTAVVFIYTFFVGVTCLFFFLEDKKVLGEAGEIFKGENCLSECAAWKRK